MILTDMNLTFPESYTVLTGLIDVCLRGNLFCFDSSFTLKWKELLFVLVFFFSPGTKEILTGEAFRTHVTFIFFPVPHWILCQSGK